MIIEGTGPCCSAALHSALHSALYSALDSALFSALLHALLSALILALLEVGPLLVLDFSWDVQATFGTFGSWTPLGA